MAKLGQVVKSWKKLTEVVEMLLLRIGITWFEGIETIQDMWRLGKIQLSLAILSTFSCVIFWAQNVSMPPYKKYVNTLRPECVNSSYSQNLMGISKHLAQKIMHEDLI